MLNFGVSKSFKPCWIDGISNEEYHANKAFVSSSQLKLLINESPDFFRDALTSGVIKEQTDAMLLSTLVHHAVLEGDDFLNRYVVMPKFDLRYTKAKDAQDQWLLENHGRIIVTEKDKEILEGTYASILCHSDARALLLGSRFERSGYYVDRETGISCRIRYDAYDESNRILTDLKAVRSCKKHDFSRAMKEYRWDLSMAMYGAGIEAIDGIAPKHYAFIAVEKTRPYQVAVYKIGSETIKLGLQDYKRALHMLEDCVKKKSWPTLQTAMEEIDLPEYFLKERLA